MGTGSVAVRFLLCLVFALWLPSVVVLEEEAAVEKGVTEEQEKIVHVEEKEAVEEDEVSKRESRRRELVLTLPL